MTATASDLVQLAKPRITGLVVFTTAIGLWLAPHGLPPVTVAFTLVGTVLIVAAANVLNMYLERDSDAFMTRTMNRPLPAQRMEPGLALRFGLLLAAVSVPLLTFAVGALPGLLAAIALVSYVLLYTPMKRQTATALLVGAIPGAIPPLIGWTAATERVELPGVLLFAVMFLWRERPAAEPQLVRGDRDEEPEELDEDEAPLQRGAADQERERAGAFEDA
ncbi:MAG: UbiA family prenyltransferase, partial [Myxococcales bacterium]